MNTLQKLLEAGQSVWFDFIRRDILENGELQGLVDRGVRGVTSNPTIFDKAISGSDDYDQAMAELVAEGRTADEIYEALAVDDIRAAADILRPVYDSSSGGDGFVSLEVSPHLAADTAGTVAEGRRLFELVDRPNLMIKVPATPEGFPAIETLVGEGINVNATLIFSLEQYERTAAAYVAGLKKLASAGGDLSKVASVASFFVSRVDGVVDGKLAEAGDTQLQGKAAVANARLAYARFEVIFAGAEWDGLAAKGARVQRPLWASTSTKNPDYPDTLYVDELVGPHTVNTLPPNTLDAALDHGKAEPSVTSGLDEARAALGALGALGIDLDEVTSGLLAAGVKSFADSFDKLMAGIAAKREDLAGD